MDAEATIANHERFIILLKRQLEEVTGQNFRITTELHEMTHRYHLTGQKLFDMQEFAIKVHVLQYSNIKLKKIAF